MGRSKERITMDDKRIAKKRNRNYRRQGARGSYYVVGHIRS